LQNGKDIAAAWRQLVIYPHAVIVLIPGIEISPC